MIFNNKKQLLPGLRKSSHGGSTRYPPDDHLKYGESFEAAGVRETRKETEPETDSQRPEITGITNDFFAESGKAGVINGRPQVTEPEKCKTRLWFNLSGLPENLFPPMRNFLAGQRPEAPLQV